MDVTVRNGTATYRCVMKGSVHARAHGYKVQYVKNAVEGDGDDAIGRDMHANFMNSEEMLATFRTVMIEQNPNDLSVYKL